MATVAASADRLSDRRLLLGVVSGDRPEEYPAMSMNFPERGTRFRESLAHIRAMAAEYPACSGDQGALNDAMDMLPKSAGSRRPILVTSGAQQSPDWVAGNSDGWMTDPRDITSQAQVVRDYRARGAATGAEAKPVMQSLYVDLGV